MEIFDRSSSVYRR